MVTAHNDLKQSSSSRHDKSEDRLTALEAKKVHTPTAEAKAKAKAKAKAEANVVKARMQLALAEEAARAIDV